MTRVEHRTLDVNGIRMHIAEQGRGPLVLLCHGFPESWYSYRHQLTALADAGYHAVAPDMRGYGQTERPDAVERYTLLHLVADVIGLIDALDAPSAVIVGHDWGAPVAWHAALLRPDRVRGVAALSVPFRPRAPRPPTSLMGQTPDAVAYTLYFQTPGVAEAELERDVRDSLARLFYAVSADALRDGAPLFDGMVPRDAGLLARTAPAPPLPGWLSAADLDFYTAEFTRTGFGGGLDWYRNMDRNWELLAAFQGRTITVPALYIAGEQDPFIRLPGMSRAIDELPKLVPRLHGRLLVPDCGHWTQQERPREVNQALLEFLRNI
jgi:pimeloyl-ACP methyl ester carboxylesterase